jgi:His/Glu/Gln/Arg/opine family amino acid ABC transporter permease subunit
MINFYGFGNQLLAGAWLTLQLSLSALVLGLILGALGAASKLSKHPILYLIASGYSSIVRGLPELIILFIIYFGGTALLNLLTGGHEQANDFVAGMVALGLLFGAYATETLRGAYLAVQRGQVEAATAYGYSKLRCLYHILLPQITRYALPGLGNLWLVLLKDTALVSLLGLNDLMSRAHFAAIYTQQPFTFYAVAAFIYLIFTAFSTNILRYFAMKLSFGARNLLISFG